MTLIMFKTISNPLFMTLVSYLAFFTGTSFLMLAAQEKSSNNPGIAFFHEMVNRFQAIRDYRCLLVKEERIENRWETEKMTLLFRKPLDIKLSWLEPHAGQQALYRQGKNNNRIRAHRGGLLRFLAINLDPLSKEAMEHTRYPITHAGLGSILEATMADISRGQCETLMLGEAFQDNRSCIHLQFRSLGARGFHQSMVTDFWMDKNLKLPIRLTMFDYEKQMIGNYFFSHMEVDVGLTDKDFEL